MSAINVNLTGKLAEFVEDRVASGQYGSPADVVRHALSLLSEDYERRHAELTAAIEVGVADIEAGRVYEGTVDDILQDVLRRSRG